MLPLIVSASTSFPSSSEAIEPGLHTISRAAHVCAVTANISSIYNSRLIRFIL